MTRDISGICTLEEQDILEIVLCDKYGRSLSEESVTVDIGTNGVFVVALEINENDTCWVAANNNPSRAFWVFAGENEQEVDLNTVVYPRNYLPVYTRASIEETSLNVNRSLAVLACGSSLPSEEEQRIICRYDAYSLGEEDVFMCKIDNGMAKI